MRSVRILAAVAATILALTVLVPSVAASSPLHPLHVTKECSAPGYTGAAGDYCTFTSSNPVGLITGTITYSSALDYPTLRSFVLIDTGTGTATGRCRLNLLTGLGRCTFWKGTGELAGFHANVVVSYLGGVNWAWDGFYFFAPPG
jgi:hypothetical protein